MTGSQTPKPSSWEILLGRSPPMPTVPPGGWTRESVREYWREGIAASPEGAPLSHAALADLLRTRDTFRNWFIVRRSTDWLRPVPLEETFIQRAYAFPLLCFFVVLGIAYALFTLFPWMRSLYPLIFLTEDTLCAAGRSVFTGPRYRCDNAVGALDFAFLSSIVCLAVIAFFFLRQGGGPVLRYSQKTKIVITNGGVFSALLLSLLVFITPAWILKFYAIDHELIPPILFITSPVLIPLAVMLLQAVWLTFRAAYAMIFFNLTGRFPSWLDDLSP